MPGLASEANEQRILLHGVSWDEYEKLRELLDRRNLRMTYLEGELELMANSSEHELRKKNIARFVELFAHVTGIDLYAYGQATFKDRAKERGAEPDECYLVSGPLKDFPEIVLEVVVSSPLLDKLKVYAGFGVAEVWVFKDGAFSLFQLNRETGKYATIERSALIPSIDFAIIASYAARIDTPRALREFEAAVRSNR